MRKTAASFALLLVGLVWLGAQSSPDAISAEDRYRLILRNATIGIHYNF